MPNALDALILRIGQEDEHSMLPVALYTGTGEDPRPRLRVDNAQTSFFENREFRLYHEFNLAAGASVYLKFVTPGENIIHGRDITMISGQIRYSLITGGTEGGVWTPKPVYPVNLLSSKPAYTPVTTVFSGGTVTGGAESDVMLCNAGTGGTAATASTQVAEGSAPPGTAYVRLWNDGAQVCVGLYRITYEEYAPKSPRLY